jgi:methyltransferase
LATARRVFCNTRNGSRAGPRILASGERCWRNTEHIMGWDIKEDGFGIVLSPELPSLLKKALAPAFDDFLDRNELLLTDFNGFLFHPGGRKVLETIEEVLGLTRDQLAYSWEVLRRYGNMSAPTALFVLEQALNTGARGPHLLAALGPGFFGLLCRGRAVIHFGWGAALLGFLTLQRIAELWWAQQNERRLFAAGGVEYGRSHLLLIVLLHSAWLIGMWALAYDRPVEPAFFVIVVLLQIARFWVLASLGRRWTIHIIVVPGEKLVARGPYRWLRHPNYTVVTGEFAAVPLALGLPLYALIFSILNAAVLAVRIPAENAALAAAASGPVW